MLGKGYNSYKDSSNQENQTLNRSYKNCLVNKCDSRPLQKLTSLELLAKCRQHCLFGLNKIK